MTEIHPLVVAAAFLVLSGAMVHRFWLERNWAIWAGILPRIYLAVIYVALWAGLIPLEELQLWGRSGLLVLVFGDVIQNAVDYVRFHRWGWRNSSGAVGSAITIAAAVMMLGLVR